MFKQLEEQTLASLVSNYPNGLNDQGWDIDRLSMNKSLTDEIVINNPNLNWDWRALLCNNNLSTEFRVTKIDNLRDMSDNDMLELQRIVIDLKILMYMLEVVEDENTLTKLISGGSLSSDAIEYLHDSKFKNSLMCITILILSEGVEWLIYNDKSWTKRNMNYLLMNDHIHQHPEWIDYLLDNVECESYLICHSSDPIGRLNKVVEENKELKYPELIRRSTSIEFIEAILKLCGDSIDDELNLEMWNSNIISDEFRVQYLADNYPSNAEEAIALLSKLRICFGVTRTMSYDLYAYINKIIQEFKIEEDGGYRYKMISLISDLKLKNVQLTIENHMIELLIEDLDSLLSLIEYELDKEISSIIYIRYSGEIDQNVLSILSKMTDYKVNWGTISTNAPYNLIIENPDMPWIKSVLSFRKYQPEARFLNTKRAI